MRRFREFFSSALNIGAIAILVVFFLLGLLGNQRGEGQVFLQVVIALALVMVIGWAARSLRDMMSGTMRDWRAVNVSQARVDLSRRVREGGDSLDLAAGFEALAAKDYRTAAAAFWLAAEQGEPVGQYYLARLFKQGHGVPRSREEAFKWLRRSAQQGLAQAEAELGDALLTGWQGAVDRDYAEALAWLNKAADKGHNFATVRIGNMYEEGSGVRRDPEEASTWYRRAAEKGDAKGQHALGRLYLAGKGLPRDLVQAYVWLRLANETARTDSQMQLAAAASADLARAQEQMTPNQVDESRWLVSQWVRRMTEAREPSKAEKAKEMRTRKRREQAFTMPIIDRIRAELSAATVGSAGSKPATAEATETSAPVPAEVPVEITIEPDAVETVEVVPDAPKREERPRPSRKPREPREPRERTRRTARTVAKADMADVEAEARKLKEATRQQLAEKRQDRARRGRRAAAAEEKSDAMGRAQAMVSRLKTQQNRREKASKDDDDDAGPGAPRESRAARRRRGG